MQVWILYLLSSKILKKIKRVKKFLFYKGDCKSDREVATLKKLSKPVISYIIIKTDSYIPKEDNVVKKEEFHIKYHFTDFLPHNENIFFYSRN